MSLTTIAVLTPHEGVLGTIEAALTGVDADLRVLPVDREALTGVDADLLIAWVAEGATHETLRALVRDAADRPLILLVDREDASEGVRAVHCGAADFVLRPFRKRDLQEAVDRALGRGGDGGPVDADGARQAFDALTTREREVLALMLDGQCNQSIADALGIAPKTVAIHVSRVLDKTGCRTLATLARTARLLERVPA